MAKIEEQCSSPARRSSAGRRQQALELTPEKQYGYLRLPRLVFHKYPKRADPRRDADDHAVVPLQRDLLHLRARAHQFYGVSATRVPLYGLAFSVGNLLGPLLLGPLFDTVGRKKMISGTYLLSGVLLAISGWLFDNGDLTANTQTFVWIVIFFFASAGASAAYLTVSETWPIEIRARRSRSSSRSPSSSARWGRPSTGG